MILESLERYNVNYFMNKDATTEKIKKLFEQNAINDAERISVLRVHTQDFGKVINHDVVVTYKNVSFYISLSESEGFYTVKSILVFRSFTIHHLPPVGSIKAPVKPIQNTTTIDMQTVENFTFDLNVIKEIFEKMLSSKFQLTEYKPKF